MSSVGPSKPERPKATGLAAAMAPLLQDIIDAKYSQKRQEMKAKYEPTSGIDDDLKTLTKSTGTFAAFMDTLAGLQPTDAIDTKAVCDAMRAVNEVVKDDDTVGFVEFAEGIIADLQFNKGVRRGVDLSVLDEVPDRFDGSEAALDIAVDLLQIYNDFDNDNKYIHAFQNFVLIMGYVPAVNFIKDNLRLGVSDELLADVRVSDDGTAGLRETNEGAILFVPPEEQVDVSPLADDELFCLWTANRLLGHNDINACGFVREAQSEDEIELSLEVQGQMGFFMLLAGVAKWSARERDTFVPSPEWTDTDLYLQILYKARYLVFLVCGADEINLSLDNTGILGIGVDERGNDAVPEGPSASIGTVYSFGNKDDQRNSNNKNAAETESWMASIGRTFVHAAAFSLDAAASAIPGTMLVLSGEASNQDFTTRRLWTTVTQGSRTTTTFFISPWIAILFLWYMSMLLWFMSRGTRQRVQAGTWTRLEAVSNFTSTAINTASSATGTVLRGITLLGIGTTLGNLAWNYIAFQNQQSIRQSEGLVDVGGAAIMALLGNPGSAALSLARGVKSLVGVATTSSTQQDVLARVSTAASGLKAVFAGTTQTMFATSLLVGGVLAQGNALRLATPSQKISTSVPMVLGWTASALASLYMTARMTVPDLTPGGSDSFGINLPNYLEAFGVTNMKLVAGVPEFAGSVKRYGDDYDVLAMGAFFAGQLFVLGSLAHRAWNRPRRSG